MSQNDPLSAPRFVLSATGQARGVLLRDFRHGEDRLVVNDDSGAAGLFAAVRDAICMLREMPDTYERRAVALAMPKVMRRAAQPARAAVSGSSTFSAAIAARPRNSPNSTRSSARLL